MSVLDSPLNVTLADRMGANDYLTKPFTQKQLTAAIEKLLKDKGPVSAQEPAPAGAPEKPKAK